MKRIVDGWREDWRNTAQGTKVFLMVMGGLSLPLLFYALLFYLTYDF